MDEAPSPREGTETAATRKRVRSMDSDEKTAPHSPDAEPVTKKISVSDVDMSPIESSLGVDRVALLDAGAQYGKVCCAENPPHHWELNIQTCLTLTLALTLALTLP